LKVVVVNNIKGGVTKTVTALNLAVLCAQKGLRTLAIDLDPQASLTDYFGLYNEAIVSDRNSVSLLYDGKSVQDCMHTTKYENLYCIPSVLELVDQNELLLTEFSLRFALKDCEDDFDVVIVDTAPSAKRLSMLAYVAASGWGSVVIPARLDSTVMRGIASAISAIESVSTKLRIPLPQFKVLRTCVPGRMTTAEKTGAAILDKFVPDNRQLKSIIHFSSKSIEASYKWEPIVTYMPKNRVASDYLALGQELELWEE
jgi:chromosome partitioning protein